MRLTPSFLRVRTINWNANTVLQFCLLWMRLNASSAQCEHNFASNKVLNSTKCGGVFWYFWKDFIFRARYNKLCVGLVFVWFCPSPWTPGEMSAGNSQCNAKQEKIWMVWSQFCDTFFVEKIKSSRYILTQTWDEHLMLQFSYCYRSDELRTACAWKCIPHGHKMWTAW